VLEVIKKAGINNPAFGLFQENANVGGGFTGPLVRNIVKDQFHRSLFGKGGFWWEKKIARVAGFEDEIRAARMGQIFKAAYNGGAVFDGNNFVVPRAAPPAGR
jgi:hypothetical protein